MCRLTALQGNKACTFTAANFKRVGWYADTSHVTAKQTKSLRDLLLEEGPRSIPASALDVNQLQIQVPVALHPLAAAAPAASKPRPASTVIPPLAEVMLLSACLSPPPRMRFRKCEAFPHVVEDTFERLGAFMAEYPLLESAPEAPAPHVRAKGADSSFC